MIQISDRVCIVDVSGELPTHKRKKWSKRDVGAINRIYFHHSGRLGASGLRGVQNSARYCVKYRNWAGLPYHDWIPHEPVMTDGLFTIFSGNPDSARVYHTGGRANTRGIGVVFQGNTSKDGLSAVQQVCGKAYIPWRMGRHNLSVKDGISWHSESKQYGGSGKKACPGEEAEKWLGLYRGDG